MRRDADTAQAQPPRGAHINPNPKYRQLSGSFVALVARCCELVLVPSDRRPGGPRGVAGFSVIGPNPN